jgi:hypothetical protein
MTPALTEYLKTDYLTILDHPALSLDMKVGYLMAVVNIDPAAHGASHLPLRELAKAMRTFVSAYTTGSW